MQSQEKQPELLKRIENVEKRVDELANHVANHAASPATLLIGWNEISRYCRKRPRTLSRYAKGKAFPAYRWAGHVVSSPHSIDAWLRAVQHVRRTRKAEAARATD